MVEHVRLIRSFLNTFITPAEAGDEKPVETTFGGGVVRWSARFCARCGRRHAGCVLCFLPEAERAHILGYFFLCMHKNDTKVALLATARAGDTLIR